MKPITRQLIRNFRLATENPPLLQRLLKSMIPTKRTVRIISLHQPYASAMALGLKLNETRHWHTDYRGPIAIHAATTTKWIWRWTLPGFLAHLGAAWPSIASIMAENGIREAADFPVGKVLGVTEIHDCVPVDMIEGASPIERALGNYEAGRFAWLTRNFQRLKDPIPERGRQRWWKWEVPADAGINLEGFRLI